MPVDRLSVALFVVCAVLLMSQGGAVVGAPVTLPLLYLAVRRHPTAAFRWAGGLIAGLTALELAWAVIYLLEGEGRASIWLVPLAVGVAVVAAFVATGRQARRSSRSPSRNHTSTPSSRSR